MAPPTDRAGFRLAVVCALPEEKQAVVAVMEKDYRDDVQTYGKLNEDENTYSLGELGGQPVVLLCLPGPGTRSAAGSVRDMRFSFPNIVLVFLVGITGGVPFSKDGSQTGVRLGDVVLSQSVIEYDFGKRLENRFDTMHGRDQGLPPIAGRVKSFIRSIQGDSNALQRLERAANGPLERYAQFRFDKYCCPGREADVIFDPTFRHKHRVDCVECANTTEISGDICERALAASCVELNCHKSLCPIGAARETSALFIGPYVSGSGVMKSAQEREQLVQSFDPLAIDMEGAGVWGYFPTMIVKGVVDYADSHKNDRWRHYSAARAALCTKAIIQEMELGTDAPYVVSAGVDRPIASPHVYLPFDRNPNFVGRVDQLDELYRRLFSPPIRCQRVAIAGLGGIGKTQVALRFAYHLRERHPDVAIFWVPAVSMETFEQAYLDLAHHLDVKTAVTTTEELLIALKRHLSSPKAGRWLLIIDNADDVHVLEGENGNKGLIEYLPRSQLGVVVFTTRSKTIAQSLVGTDVIDVGTMTPEEAASLLRNSLRSPSDDARSVKHLIHELSYLPLAITQAAAFVNVNGITVAEYLDLLRSTAAEDSFHILSSAIIDSTRYSSAANAVATTWLVTFKQISKLERHAATLLRFISCIEWEAVPYSILPEIGSTAALKTAIGLLCAYNFLIRRGSDDTYDMHRLVHLAIKIWVRQESVEDQVWHHALGHLEQVFPSGTYRVRQRWRDFLPHVPRFESGMWKRNIHSSGMLYWKVGRCSYEESRYSESVYWLEQCLKCWRGYPEDDKFLLQAQLDLSRAYEANNQAQDAIRLLGNAAEVHKDLPVDNFWRMQLQLCLAVAYRSCGLVQEATVMLRLIVQAHESLPKDNLDRLDSQCELAKALLRQGQNAEAIEILKHIVMILRTRPEDDPRLLIAQYAYAEALLRDGQTRLAISTLEHIDRVEDVLGPDHMTRAGTQMVLAEAYIADGRIEPAVSLIRHVVAIQTKNLDETHPYLLRSRLTLIDALEKNGKTGEAAQERRHVAEVEARTRPVRERRPGADETGHEAPGPRMKSADMTSHEVAMPAGKADVPVSSRSDEVDAKGTAVAAAREESSRGAREGASQSDESPVKDTAGKDRRAGDEVDRDTKRLRR